MGGPGSGRRKGSGGNKARLAAGAKQKRAVAARVQAGGKQTKREANQFGKVAAPKKMSKREKNQFGKW